MRKGERGPSSGWFRRRALAAVALAGVTLAASSLLCGCADTDVDVTVDGALDWGSCTDLLPWRPTFATARDSDSGLVLRFQSGQGPADAFVDALLLTIVDDAVAGGVYEVTPLSPDAAAHGALTFTAGCPDERALSGVLVGTLTLTEWSGRFDTRVEGVFEGSVVDGRDFGVVRSSDLVVTFSFPYLRSRPWQTFTSPPPQVP